MSLRYQELALRIKGELADLDRVASRALRSWPAAKRGGPDDVHVDSVALNLHSFYSGLERLFELIARNVDGHLPSGSSWHEELLGAMARGVESIRPAVISPESATALDEYRRFRHLVRNVYAANLLPSRMEGLTTHLEETWARIRSELSAFADFLLAAAS